MSPLSEFSFTTIIFNSGENLKVLMLQSSLAKLISFNDHHLVML
jgi:hypothetical protein